MTNKLFMFYLGGRVKGANIEVHDVFFGIGEKAEDCYDSIKKHWFGEKKGLHVDCYAPVEYVDGFDVTVEKKHPIITTRQKHFFS